MGSHRFHGNRGAFTRSGRFGVVCNDVPGQMVSVSAKDRSFKAALLMLA